MVTDRTRRPRLRGRCAAALLLVSMCVVGLAAAPAVALTPAATPGVTPTTRRLLDYWTDPARDRKLFFAQVEAVETAIYIGEVINKALAQNPNYIKYLYVDKLSDKVSVIVSDQNTIMDLKGILEGRPK